MNPNTPMTVEHFQQAICAILAMAGFVTAMAVSVGSWLNRQFMKQLEANSGGGSRPSGTEEGTRGMPKAPYDADFSTWTQAQTAALWAKQFDTLDLEPWRRRAKRWASTSAIYV
jgi:hypothetical protein